MLYSKRSKSAFMKLLLFSQPQTKETARALMFAYQDSRCSIFSGDNGLQCRDVASGKCSIDEDVTRYTIYNGFAYLDGVTSFSKTIDNVANKRVNPKHYKEEEDPRFFQSPKTHRGLLVEGWRNFHQPIMCFYKLVSAYLEVWGLQTKVEEFIHSCIRELLLLRRRQAFAWIDSWIDMSYDDVNEYEKPLHLQTNTILQVPEEKPLSETEKA